MALEFGAHGPGAIEDAGYLVAKLRHIDHFLHVAKAIGPVGVVLAGQRAGFTALFLAAGIGIKEPPLLKILCALAATGGAAIVRALRRAAALLGRVGLLLRGLAFLVLVRGTTRPLSGLLAALCLLRTTLTLTLTLLPLALPLLALFTLLPLLAFTLLPLLSFALLGLLSLLARLLTLALPLLALFPLLVLALLTLLTFAGLLTFLSLLTLLTRLSLLALLRRLAALLLLAVLRLL